MHLQSVSMFDLLENHSFKDLVYNCPVFTGSITLLRPETSLYQTCDTYHLAPSKEIMLPVIQCCHLRYHPHLFSVLLCCRHVF